MNMKQLRYVLVLANKKSFAKAAEELNISQPSLSQYIKKIEQQVGMELFDRGDGYVRLTDAGQIYVEAGRKILDLEYQMQNQFSDIAAYRTGSVTVGTSPFRSAGMMPRVVSTFRQIYPGIHVVIEEMTSSELLEASRQGKFDICLTVLPIDEREFNWEMLMNEELVLAVPSSFPALHSENIPTRKYPTIDVAQLNGCRFVAITESQIMQKTLDNLCFDNGIAMEKAVVVKSLAAQIAMVRAGVGMALVPTGIETFCSKNEVVFYSFRQRLPQRQVVAMWRKDRNLNRATRALIDIMKDPC